MNDTGLPSPFIDIMMLRPALRTSHNSFCACGSVMRTSASRRPRSPEELAQADEPSRQLDRVAAGELDQQDRRRFAGKRAVDHRTERRIAAREIDHRAIDEFDRGGFELDDVLRRFHRRAERSGS